MTKEDAFLWKFGFDVFQVLTTVAIATYAWLVTKHKVNANKIEELEAKHYKQIHELKVELTSVKTTIQHMPDKRSIHNIHERLNAQSEVLKKMEGEMKGVTDNTAMILQALVKKGSDNS